MVEERRRGVRDKRTIGGGAPPSSLGSFAYSTAAMAAAPSGREGGSGREPLSSVRSTPVQKSRTQKSDARCEARRRPGEPQATLGEPAGPCPVASNTTWVGPAGSSSVAYTSPGHRLAFTSWRLSSTYVITSFVRDGGGGGERR